MLMLSSAFAREGESLSLIDEELADENEVQNRRLGEPGFLAAYVLLAGLGVLTTIRRGVEE